MRLERLGEFKVVSLRECPPTSRAYDTPESIVEYYRQHVVNDPRHNPDVETFIEVLLSTRRHIIGYQVVSTGTLDTILVHPREVFRGAIIAAAAAIICVHNHPSGDPTPSEADIKVTRDLIRAGQLLKLELLDHVIIGTPTPERTRDYASLRELGYFYS